MYPRHDASVFDHGLGTDEDHVDLVHEMRHLCVHVVRLVSCEGQGEAHLRYGWSLLVPRCLW
jgi:hypothetical protein